jgi:hypothetical protein
MIGARQFFETDAFGERKPLPLSAGSGRSPPSGLDARSFVDSEVPEVQLAFSRTGETQCRRD